MGYIDKGAVTALALIGFFYILCVFVLPWGGIGLLIAAAIMKSSTLAWWGVGVLFGPYVIAAILQGISATLKRPRR